MPTLSIDIEARLASFQDSLDKIGRQGEQVANRMSKAFGAVRGTLLTFGAALSAGAFASFVKSGIDAADHLNKLSQKVGVTVESLSALQYAANLSDVSAEQLSTGLARLARSASEAASGSKESAEAFTAIGVAVKDASGNLRGTEELLLDLAEQFAGMEDSAQKTALAMRIFGKSGAELIPFLNLGRAGFAEIRQEAERLGIVLSAETAKAAEEFNDNLTRLGTQADRLKFALAESLLPAISRVAQGMADAVRGGEGLLGIFRALTALSPVNDLQRASKEFSELVGEQLSIENEIARRTGKAGSDELAALNERLSATKTRIGELQKLLGVLRGETDAFGDPKKPASGGKRLAPTLPSGAGGEDKGEQFLETLRRRLTAITENEYAVLRLEAAQKKVAGAAEPLILQLQRETEFRKELDAARSRDEQAAQAEVSRRVSLVNGVADYVKGLEQEVELSRLSSEQRLIQIQLLRLEEAGLQRNSEEFAAAAERIRAAVNASAGAEVFQATRTEMERIREELARLQDLYVSGAIDAETYRRAVEKLNEEFRKTKTEADKSKDIGKELGLSFSSAFEDAVSGGKKFRDVLRGLEQDIIRIVTRKLVTEPLAEGVTGILKGVGGGGGIGEFFGSIFKGIFGGARAEGGPVSPGKGYIVGERGPEWFMPSTSGAIVPAGGTTINYNPTFVIRGEANTPQSRSQIAAAAWRGLQDGRRNL